MRSLALTWLAPAAGAAVISLFAASPLAAQQGSPPDTSSHAVGPSSQSSPTQANPPGRPEWLDRDEQDETEGQGSDTPDNGDDDDTDDDDEDGDQRNLRDDVDRKQGRDDAAKTQPPAQMGMRRAFCGPLGERFANARLSRMERVIEPSGEQRAAFDKLREAMGQAQEKVAASCTQERPLTATGRLAALENRLEASLDAVKTVRPALDALFAMLSDEQKARLQLMTPRRSFHGHSFQHRGEAGMEPHRRYRSETERSDWDRGRRDRPASDDRGYEQEGGDDAPGHRGWRDSAPDDPDDRANEPIRRDRDRDGWPDRWRGRS